VSIVFYFLNANKKLSLFCKKVFLIKKSSVLEDLQAELFLYFFLKQGPIFLDLFEIEYTSKEKCYTYRCKIEPICWSHIHTEGCRKGITSKVITRKGEVIPEIEYSHQHERHKPNSNIGDHIGGDTLFHSWLDE